MGNMVVKLFINLNSISLAHLRRECTDPITESIPPLLIPSFPPPCPPICPPICPPWPLVLPNHLSGLYLSTPRAREGGTNMRKSWKLLIVLVLLFSSTNVFHFSIHVQIISPKKTEAHQPPFLCLPSIVLPLFTSQFDLGPRFSTTSSIGVGTPLPLYYEGTMLRERRAHVWISRAGVGETERAYGLAS